MDLGRLLELIFSLWRTGPWFTSLLDREGFRENTELVRYRTLDSLFTTKISQEQIEVQDTPTTTGIPRIYSVLVLQLGPI